MGQSHVILQGPPESQQEQGRAVYGAVSVRRLRSGGGTGALAARGGTWRLVARCSAMCALCLSLQPDVPALPKAMPAEQTTTPVRPFEQTNSRLVLC